MTVTVNENEYLITADGQVYPLAYYGAKVTGLGSLPVEYQTTQGYKQHGVTVRDYRMQPRSISIVLTLNAMTHQLLWTLRSQIIGAVNPEHGAVTYRKVLPDGQVREIKGWLEESLSIEDADDLRSAEVGLSLMCPDPSFYSPALKTATAANETSAALVLPVVLPDDFWFGGANQYPVDIDYMGTWRGYPQLIIRGPYDSARIS
uniref:phage tail domain-containing protein n=1 Tax=Aggregatilinea sp. TaxID=2806333 RepID=UPI002BD0B82D